MSQEFNKAFQSRLMMDGKTGSEVCPFCKQKVTPCEYEGGNFSSTTCSEFCERVTLEELKTFFSAKEGDFCCYPCSECGCCIEDDLTQGSNCWACEPNVRARVRADLLRRVLHTLVDYDLEEIEVDLVKDIQKELTE